MAGISWWDAPTPRRTVRLIADRSYDRGDLVRGGEIVAEEPNDVRDQLDPKARFQRLSGRFSNAGFQSSYAEDFDAGGEPQVSVVIHDQYINAHRFARLWRMAREERLALVFTVDDRGNAQHRLYAER